MRSDRESLREGLERQAMGVRQVAHGPVEPGQHQDFEHCHLRQVPPQVVSCFVGQIGRRMQFVAGADERALRTRPAWIVAAAEDQ